MQNTNNFRYTTKYKSINQHGNSKKDERVYFVNQKSLSKCQVLMRDFLRITKITWKNNLKTSSKRLLRSKNSTALMSGCSVIIIIIIRPTASIIGGGVLKGRKKKTLVLLPHNPFSGISDNLTAPISLPSSCPKTKDYKTQSAMLCIHSWGGGRRVFP